MSAQESQQVKTFAVPDLGEGLEDVTITAWNVAVGDEVALNQVLCTVETAKAEVEIPSPYAGRVLELGGECGQVLDVGVPLVRIGTAGPGGTAAEPETAVEPAPEAAAQPAPEAAVPAGVNGVNGVNGTGAANGVNGAAGGRRAVLVGYGADDAFDTSRRTPQRVKAKPAARKLAAELGVDLSRVAPGEVGIITVEAVRAASGATASGYDVAPISAVQAAMAERMTLSRSQIPDADASVEVDGTRLLELRDRLVAAGADRAVLTPFVLTLRLLVIALTHHPAFNSTWASTPQGPQVRTHRSIHLGFGVAAPRGLLVPVIADAQRKTTRELAEAVAGLIARARAGTLKPAELQGSTFTVSNFGALGLDDGVPVINHPEAAILGIGALKPRPAVVDGQLAVRPLMRLTCAFDHRIIDGAQVAAFLGELRGLIEAPETALLEL